MSGISREIHHRPRGPEPESSLYGLVPRDSEVAIGSAARKRSQGREPSRRRQMLRSAFSRSRLFCKLESALRQGGRFAGRAAPGEMRRVSAPR